MEPPRLARALGALSVCGALGGCVDSGALTSAESGDGRLISSASVVVPEGYLVRPLATDLNNPTGVTTDERGNVYVSECPAQGPPRLLRLEPGGDTTVIAAGRDQPWRGLDYSEGAFFVAEGGPSDSGRILRIQPRADGAASVVLADGLPSFGGCRTNSPVVGPDGYIYFGRGNPRGNGGGPGHDPSRNPDSGAPSEVAGALWLLGGSGRGSRAAEGPSVGSIMRVATSGGRVETVAWGLQNPFGLAFSNAGRLFVADAACDAGEKTPLLGAGDGVWRALSSEWPDGAAYQGGSLIAISLPTAQRSPATQHVPSPELFRVRAAASGIDFSRSREFGFIDQAFIVEFGDLTPVGGNMISPAGFKVVRVDPRTGEVRDFATNASSDPGQNGQPRPSGGLERPIAVRFSRDGSALYILDPGAAPADRSSVPSGVLWRVTRVGAVNTREARR